MLPLGINHSSKFELMKNQFFILGLMTILSTLIWSNCQQAENIPSVKSYTIEQFLNTTNIFGGSFSPDQKELLVTSNESGIFNAYTIPVDGGTMTPLTASKKESIFAISYFPEDKRILFSSDDNGNEISHLFVRNEDGTIQELTPGEKARANFYGWAHDGKSFFYGFSQRDPRYMDVYEMNIADFTSTLIYQNDEAYSFNGISNDKNWMALSKAITTDDSNLFLYNFQSKDLTQINKTQAAYQATDFSVNSDALYFLTNEGGEFMRLAKYDIASGEEQKVMNEDWDIAYAYFSHNGKYQVVGINEDGKNVIKVFEAASGQQIEFPKFDNGDITSVGISRNEDIMRFYVGSSSTPSNLYTYDFASKEHNKLTNTLNKEIVADDLVTAEVVRYPSFDNLDIPAIYYKPKQATPNNKVPALVWVHGGPGGQSRQGYSALIQYLVNHGYAVLAVNNRGSSGYGKTFFKMDNKNHGEKDLMDCIYGRKYLETLDYIDKDKIGIIGGSYGGFMTMAALVRQPEAFDVGVNIFGVTNWLRTLKSIPPWWESFKDALYEEMGDPNVDSVRLHRISPLFHAERVVRPLMVLQGAKDPRVLQVESDEIVAAVKKNGVPVDYVLFEDEGHGFQKKENQIEAYSGILNFLDTHLKQEKEIKG